METTQLPFDGAVRQRKIVNWPNMFALCNIYGALLEQILSCALSLLFLGGGGRQELWTTVQQRIFLQPEQRACDGAAQEKYVKNSDRINRIKYVSMWLKKAHTSLHVPCHFSYSTQSFFSVSACQRRCCCFSTLRSTCHSCHIQILVSPNAIICSLCGVKVYVLLYKILPSSRWSQKGCQAQSNTDKVTFRIWEVFTLQRWCLCGCVFVTASWVGDSLRPLVGLGGGGGGWTSLLSLVVTHGLLPAP